MMTSSKNRADLDDSMRKIGESPEQFGEVLNESSANAAVTPRVGRSAMGATVAAIAALALWVVRRRRARENTGPWQRAARRARSRLQTVRSRAEKITAKVRH
jgi:hypothetical protein